MIEPGVRRENFRLARPRARWTSQVALVVKNLPANAGDIREVGSISGSGRSPGGGHINLLQCSCLENPMDGGAWWVAVHRVAKSDLACTRARRKGTMGL